MRTLGPGDVKPNPVCVMVIKLNSTEETTLGWSFHWEWEQWVLWCSELNLRANGQGPSSVIQTSRSPDFVVCRLSAQVSTLTNKQAVLDFLLWAIIMRKSPTTRREGLEVKGLLTPTPTICAPICGTTCATLTSPRSGQCHCQQTCKEKRGLVQKRFGFALFYHVKLK